MDSQIDDLNELSIEEIIVPDFVDDEYVSGAEDDQINDTEDDQVFDKELIREVEQGNAIVLEPEKYAIPDDEERDSNDSGVEENDASDIEGKSSRCSPIISHILGRGRQGKKRLNEFNQASPASLIRDVEQGNAIASKLEESGIFGDEEKDRNERGVEQSDASNIEGKFSMHPPIIVQPIRAVGRGRYVKTPMDELDEQLPAPQVRDVEPEKDFYPKPVKKATLPNSYYRKRDPELQNQRRALGASSPLIDFRAEFDQISFIVDRDDSDEKGYQHACRRLQQIQPNSEIDLSKSQYDLWSFGLYIYQVTLKNRVSCNLLDLIPQEINNEENRPFWFMFKRPPKFQDSELYDDKTAKQSDSRKGTSILMDPAIYADLSYGALTSMNRFCVHKDCIFRKRTRWSLYFHDEVFEIQTIVPEGLKDNGSRTLTQKRHRITLDIIDRAAIIHLWNDGFSLFLNMKGNIHELHREYKPRNPEESDFEPFKRQGMRNNKPMPLFSTIRLRIRLKDDQAISELLDREENTLKNTSDGKDHLVKTTREESLERIREIFKTLLDFFYKNRIHVCFGPVYQKMASLDQLSTLGYHIFPTFIQSYSWAMICNISFRLQIQLHQSKTFIDRLKDYSKSKYAEESPSDIDDRFYRLCLYLHRRSSEYFFLDLDKEIEIGIAEYDAKYQRLKQRKDQRLKQRKVEISKYNQRAPSTAYIPSVVLTPTMIKIRPLKLCKLNRVLREKRFGGVLNFALVELRDEAQRLLFPTEFRSLKKQILYFLTNGFSLTSTRVYKYLHHSQSQVKCKQFWFYHHDKENGCLSHEDAYIWMGNFDKERVVAKHAARIALCFTSTDATIQIIAEKVTYDRDVKDATNKYTFTDGVGTISPSLRDEIKDFLNHRYEFSVLQIRYGGCKGTLSVDPRLDNQQYQLRIRDSMNKFTTDHDLLEVCKLSAPRPLYLNRQDIVLLESRGIPHANFLQLQNKDHLWLIRALLTPSIAYELLQEKLLPVFKLHEIARNLNIVEEQFFIKLIITCAFNIIREVLDRTRIRISDKKAKNMFGIVDEYGVLEYGQVFIQYSLMRENKLALSKQEEEKQNSNRCEILIGKVVITKNPCHHPGDLRVFEAVDHPELRHLKDVVVFPQKGPRPHSNEISGSDLDGDEYVVIWHEDLIPETPNEIPYDYDSQEEPIKMNRPITRDDINQVVLEISEQDCLGTLSNIHLAYADKDGITSETCKLLAGAISQEVDAPKTGKHPLSENEIAKYRKDFGEKWPDFMKGRGKKEFYPSKLVLGKLYRSARRAVIGWSRAISNHGNPRHVHLALALAAGTDIKDQDKDEPVLKTNTLLYYKQPLDPYINHDDHKKYLLEIKSLYKIYRNDLLEIISLYRFQDEIDLFCRCESMDASAGGRKKGSLEDSAAIEVQNLVRKITEDFFFEFDQRNKIYKCCQFVEKPGSNPIRWKRIDCPVCHEGKLAKAACAYIHSYNESNRLPLKSNRRILSFPWLFSGYLLKLRYRNRPQDFVDQTNTIVGRACALYLKEFTPKFKVFIPENSIDIQTVEFSYKKIEEKRTTLLPINKKTDEKIPFVPLLRACFVEILNDWLTKQGIFGNECIETDPKPLIPESIWHELLINFLSYEYQPNVRLLFASKDQSFITDRYHQTIERYSLKWTNTEYQELEMMFDEIHAIAERYAQTTKSTIWNYLDEYIILALQCIGIEKRLTHDWICPPSSF